jgi:drug/metabolite transporter (DMT)-like permease
MSKVTMQGFLALLITAGFIGCIALLVLVKSAPVTEMKDTLLVLTGALAAAFGHVVTYYYGSSQGSARKDLLLANSMPVAGVDK